MTAVYRPQFWIDVEDGVAYLAERAPSGTVARWHAAVMRACARIERRPDIGRPRHDLPWPDMRSLPVERFVRYLVFYRWSGNTLEILRVKHGMMELPELFLTEESNLE